jgi:multiple antibiotic resistance protein
LTEVLRTAVGVFAALAPLALVPAITAVQRDGERRTPALAVAAALGLLLLAVVVTDPFLGALDVVPESFQGAAALIMLPLAAQLLWTGRSVEPGEGAGERRWLMPLAVPGLAGPAALAAAVAYAARYGEGEAAAGVVAAVAAAAVVLSFAARLEARLGRLALGVLGRLSGAFIVVIALELVVDGVRSV